jgi:hypothetical protein
MMVFVPLNTTRTEPLRSTANTVCATRHLITPLSGTGCGG